MHRYDQYFLLAIMKELDSMNQHVALGQLMKCQEVQLFKHDHASFCLIILV